MNNNITVQSLSRDEAPRAWPLVKTLCPETTEARWSEFVEECHGRGLSERTAGIMVAKDARGYVVGLYSYVVEEDLTHGRTLEVDHFIAADFVGRGRIPASLRLAMDKQAAALNCQAVHVNLSGAVTPDAGHGSALVAGFREDGHAVEGLRLCKRVNAGG